MLNSFLKYYHTLKYLKPIQVYYQLKYRGRKAIGYKSKTPNVKFFPKAFQWDNVIKPKILWNGISNFTFLNLSRSYDELINWNDASHGKLWTYNLNYFEFLLQSNISKEKGLRIISNYINNYFNLIDGKEPYPTSLRLINWIKFINQYEIDNDSIVQIIGQDAYRLLDNLEFHLLANHLLENGFALLFAGIYLQDDKVIKKGRQIISSQLEEQILNDGAHYELSAMYHQLMLHRVLDSVQLLRASSREKSLLELLESTAAKMLAWLNAVTFDDGSIPLVNDAAQCVNASTAELADYAQRLNIDTPTIQLKESGYRKITKTKYELFLDVGDIKPTYQPGHAHADTFSYLICSDEKPFVVEAGTSTYENNIRRKYERSTAAHNAVELKGVSSSKVWSSFRVAQRAKVNIIDESSSKISARHNGYNIFVSRDWNYQETFLEINDTLETPALEAISYIHFHPEILIMSSSSNTLVTNRGEINCSGHSHMEISDYGYSDEFNKEVSAKVLLIYFSQSLITKFIF